MRKTLAVLLTLVFVVAMVTTSFATEIRAGQTMPVTQHVYMEDETIFVKMIEGYELEEVHAHYGKTLADFPLTKTGNPKIGLFEFTEANFNEATGYYEIPIPGVEENDLVALHVVVTDCECFEETGWLFGCPELEFEGSNWAVYTRY